MNRVIRKLALAAVGAAITAPAVLMSADASSATPAQTVLWSQHTRIGAGGVDYTSQPVTIPAITPGATETQWYFRYQWHCKPGVFASPQVYYTTSDGQHVGLVVDDWAAKDHGLHYFPTTPAGTTIQIHWRMDVGMIGNAVGSGGMCGHGFRITQSS